MMINKKYITITIISIMALSLIITLSIGAVAQEDNVRTVTIELNDNGDAQWTIDIKQHLENDDDVETFEDWITELETNSDYEDEQRDRFNSIIEISSEETNRNMDLENMNVYAYIDGSTGITTIEFTWQGFSNINNEQLTVGDVFHDGYNLESNEELQIVWNEEQLTLVESQYELQSQQQESNLILWSGEGTFGENEPNLIFDIISDESTTDDSETDEFTTDDSDTGDDITDTTNDDTPGFGIIIAGISIIGLIGLLYMRKYILD